MSKKCFIICPISEEGSDIRKRSDLLMKFILEPICSELDFEVIRIDKLPHNNSITEAILNHLEVAELVISDITGHNPNCFYESGFRAALKKPLIFMKNENEKIPFDISTIRTLEYTLNDLEKVEKTKNELRATIENIDFSPSINSKDNKQNNLEILNKILNLLLNLENKIDKFNTDTISVLSEKLITATRPKSDNELFIELMKSCITNPEAFKTLIELGNAADKLASK